MSEALWAASFSLLAVSVSLLATRRSRTIFLLVVAAAAMLSRYPSNLVMDSEEGGGRSVVALAEPCAAALAESN